MCLQLSAPYSVSGKKSQKKKEIRQYCGQKPTEYGHLGIDLSLEVSLEHRKQQEPVHQ